MLRILIIVGVLLPFVTFSQSVKGKVLNSKNEALVGASVYWGNTSEGVFTDTAGIFEIPMSNQNVDQLVASYIGFASDTLDYADGSDVVFQLREANAIDGVVVKGRREGIIVSTINPINTETINQTELKKAACCDLAGCFGTQTSVQPHTTNVLTNSKELRILGLSGVYNQVLINGLPMIQGLSYTYGISSLPGTVVDNIYISKGANSVLQGFESISGQINVQTRSGDTEDRVLLNAYINSFYEKHVNLNIAGTHGNWKSLTAIHAVQPASKFDRDKDFFLDLPLLTRTSFSSTWKYRDAVDWGWSSEMGVRYFEEKRIGGQANFDEEIHTGGTQYYGQVVELSQPEVWTKSGFRFDDYHNFVINASAFTQKQSSTFGTVAYNATQYNAYLNAQYEHNYKDHDLKTGLSFRYQNLDEDVHFTVDNLPRTYDGNYKRTDLIPGIFAENTMRFLSDRLTWIAGIRSDYHNLYGNFITPRTLVKYDFSPQTVVRANFGTGWRTANIFSENINLLVSSRDVIISETLAPEQAINYGINLIQKYDFANASGYLSFDFYRTEFQNQIFPDFDRDPTKAFVDNFNGISIANGFQAEVNVNLYEAISLKAGYNYLDVFRVEEEEKVTLPFNSKHRLLGVLSYRPASNKYFIDINGHWYGAQRLPNTSNNPLEFQRPDYSQPYTVVNAQFTYKFKNLEVYTGCENIFDFRQERPIISWEDPFSPYFDSNSVWGPTRGREFYLGFRYYLKKKGVEVEDF